MWSIGIHENVLCGQPSKKGPFKKDLETRATDIKTEHRYHNY